MLERNPALKPEELRAILMKTARDLGSPGRDDLFGAGEADAFAAVSAVGAAPVAAMPGPPAGATGEKVSDRQQVRPPGRWTGPRPPWPPTSPLRATLIAPLRNSFHPEKRPPKKR